MKSEFSGQAGPMPRVVVSINRLVGITADPCLYRWLREGADPVDTIAYSYLVYEISELDSFTINGNSGGCTK